MTEKPVFCCDCEFYDNTDDEDKCWLPTISYVTGKTHYPQCEHKNFTGECLDYQANPDALLDEAREYDSEKGLGGD